MDRPNVCNGPEMLVVTIRRNDRCRNHSAQSVAVIRNGITIAGKQDDW
jgi:hypothetical protein